MGLFPRTLSPPFRPAASLNGQHRTVSKRSANVAAHVPVFWPARRDNHRRWIERRVLGDRLLEFGSDRPVAIIIRVNARPRPRPGLRPLVPRARAVGAR